MNEDFNFDTGENLTGLGYFFLFLRYLLPVILWLGLIVGVYFLLRHWGFDILAIRLEDINFMP